MRIKISELQENNKCSISGCVEKVRDTKYMVFLVLRDTSGHIQVSIEKKEKEELASEVIKLTIGSFVTFVGKMVFSEYVKDGGKEFIPESLEVLSLAEISPIEENANVDTKMDYRWID